MVGHLPVPQPPLVPPIHPGSASPQPPAPQPRQPAILPSITLDAENCRFWLTCELTTK